MRRRDFIRVLSATTSLAVLRRSFAQPAVTRGAIVIGVNKTGDLPVLSAAVSGAREVSGWLRSEGFEVKEFLDDTGPVTVSSVFDAVDAFIRLETLEQLVVYFSGHGFLVNFAEHWLLSKAPYNPNESISTVESVTLARTTGIRNVVFISDACRSTSASLGAQGMQGALIFPNSGDSGDGNVEVDQFFAALPGKPALELPVTDSVRKFEGIYTAAFLNAYKQPDQTMVRTVGDVSFVPNRRMKEYLAREVNRRAEEHSINLTQQPEARIESDESTYLGRVSGTPKAGVAAEPAPLTISDVAASAMGEAGLTRSRPPARPEDVAVLARESGFQDVRARILTRSSNQIRGEIGNGFVIYGAQVINVTASKPELRAELLEKGGDGDRAAVIRVAPMAGSVAIRFADGSGSVVAALPNYVGTLIVQKDGVADLSYLSRDVDPSSLQRVNELRASVAAAAQYGVFRLEGDRETRNQRASELADRIRILKGIDPALGLYAAYAYFEADLLEKVRSVSSFMRGDLGVDLFDVAMLTGALSAGAPGRPSRVEPICPMLTQGWGLLRVRGVELPGPLLEVRNHLKQSLWTTFDGDGMKVVEEYVRRG